MKKTTLAIIGVAALLATSVSAQTNDQIKAAFLSFDQSVLANRSLSIAAYPSYAPSIVVNGKKDNFGFGLAAVTPASVVPGLQGTAVGNHGFMGLRFDYLAHQAFASTVGIGVQYELQVKGHNFDWFGHTGANIPFSGFGVHNGDIGGMVGAGGYTDLYRFSTNAGLGLQISGEKWTQFPGIVLHGGPVFNWKF